MTRVLIVDDNVDGADMLAQLVRMCGHEAAVSNDGPAALEMVEQFLPDLMLLDIVMPGMDGFEVADRVREQHPDSPRLVGISGYPISENDARQHFDDFVRKPIGIDHLRAIFSC